MKHTLTNLCSSLFDRYTVKEAIDSFESPAKANGNIGSAVL